MAVGGHDDTLAGTVGSTLAGVGSAPKIAADPAQRIAGRYEIVRLLGGGGMGRVYEALDGELGERVALKVLHGGITDESLERFRREVRLTRKIQHKNVARMFDIGDHAGEKFLTMELVEGEALTRVMAAGPMSWHRLRPAALQIAAGLAAAHECGVVHRDLKPDNVLVELATGRHVITDFGIARGGGDPNVTMVGAVVGTPRYMAPEQLAGRETNERADLFSFGVMLYEMASGGRPWPGDNPIAIAVAQATQPVTPLVAPGLPEQFIGLVMQCLSIEPGERPHSAQAMFDRITTETVAGSRVPTPPAGVRAASAAHVTPTINAALSTAQNIAAQRAIGVTTGGGGSTPTGGRTVAFQPHVDTSLAVLPVSCAPGDEYLADGMQEDLIDTLSTMQGVRVRPAGLVRGFADPDVRELGKKLGVEQVVTASLRRLPTGGLRVSGRLISVGDGFQIWAHRADCTDADVLAQSEVLASGIAGALSSRAVPATKPTDPRAVDLYLRARAELRQFWGKHAKAAAELLEEAARLAPDSTPIVGALAYASVQAWVMVAEEGLLAPALVNLERGLATGHGEAFLASAIVKFNQGDSLGGAADLRTAVVRAPMSAQTHEYLAKILVEIGRVEEAQQHFKQAIGLDPGRTLLVQSDLARLAALFGDVEGARRSIEMLDSSPDGSLNQLAVVFRSRIDGWQGLRDPLHSAAARLATRFGHNALQLASIVQNLAGQNPVVDRAAWERYCGDFIAEKKPRRLQMLAFQLMTESTAVIGADELVFSAADHAARIGLLDVVWMDRCPLFARFRTDLRWMEVRGRVAAHAEAVSAILRDF